MVHDWWVRDFRVHTEPQPVRHADSASADGGEGWGMERRIRCPPDRSGGSRIRPPTANRPEARADVDAGLPLD